MTTRSVIGRAALAVLLFVLMGVGAAVRAQQTQQAAPNQILGEVQFEGKDKAEKTAGVWVDGQYVGYASELKGDKKIMLLPGQHEVSLRQSGYLTLTQTILVEPAKRVIVTVNLEKDPKAQFSAVTSEIKLKVTPERAAVFVDDNFAGYVSQFNGVGKGMLVSPGAHHIKIALPGYQQFDSDVNLLPKQKVTIRTDLVPGSITQAPPAVKSN
jgi:hypothetical protein